MNFQELIGRSLGLENVKSIDQIEPSFAAPWAHHTPALVLVGCLLLSAVAISFYLRYQPGARRNARLALGVVRALSLSLLLVFLADPVLNIRLTSNPRPLLWVLFDGTDSMGIKDEMPDADRARLAAAVGAPEAKEPGDAKTAKLSRAQYVRDWVDKKEDNPLKKLAEKFRIRTFIFDRPDGVRNIDSKSKHDEFDTAELAGHLTTDGQVTALGKALDDLSQRHSSTNLAGLVVVSDFDWNAGPPPDANAKKLHVPIYTVGVGPKEAIDLGVDLHVDPIMKKAEGSTIAVTLRQHGLEGESVTVNVTARKLGGSSEELSHSEPLVVGQKTVELKGPSASTELPFTPEEAGRFEFAAEVAPLAGEVIDQNNRATREALVKDDFLRLMFVEYEPSWEWRFIKEVFHRDKLVGMRGFRTFLRSADPKVRTTNELFLPTMTPQRSEFFANDVIFLADMPSATLTPRFCEMVKEYVGTFGGGLVVIAGRRFGPGQLANTALADILPVVVDPDGRANDQREFRPAFTPQTQIYNFMQLSDNEAENKKAWDNLGPLDWYQPVARLNKDRGIALAVHPSDMCQDGKTPQPLIAIGQYGKGHVVYLGFDETWRLRRKYGERYYRQFWGQMIQFLGLSHELGSQKRFVVNTDRQKYQADEEVILTVEAYDANFEKLTDDKLPERKLVGELIAPGTTNDSMEPQRLVVGQTKEGLFETRIRAAQAGEFRVRLKDPVTGEFTEKTFQVTALSAERRNPRRNVEVQESVTQNGGKAYDLETAYQLASDVELKPIKQEEHRVFELWQTWLGFGVVVALLLGEWFVRKLINLP